jgi:hypothetical protein
MVRRLLELKALVGSPPHGEAPSPRRAEAVVHRPAGRHRSQAKIRALVEQGGVAEDEVTADRPWESTARSNHVGGLVDAREAVGAGGRLGSGRGVVPLPRFVDVVDALQGPVEEAAHRVEQTPAERSEGAVDVRRHDRSAETREIDRVFLHSPGTRSDGG